MRFSGLFTSNDELSDLYRFLVSKIENNKDYNVSTLFDNFEIDSKSLIDKVINYFKEKEGILYGTSIVWGMILLILIPIIAIIALITVIGSALGFAAILAYTVILVYSTVITGYLLGTTLFVDKNMNKYLVGIIGITAIEILRRLPVIGGLISFVVILIAFGMIKEIIKKEKAE